MNARKISFIKTYRKYSNELLQLVKKLAIQVLISQNRYENFITMLHQYSHSFSHYLRYFMDSRHIHEQSAHNRIFFCC